MGQADVNEASTAQSAESLAPPELWDEDRLAAYLGVGLRFVRRLCEEERIRFILIARHRRFDPADVAAYIEAEKRGATTANVDAPAKRRPGRPIGSGRVGRRTERV
ncbi:MAG: excisionase family DNA-binding protein [Acidimicrobiales bacterium]